jgi:hypothetical protein
MTEEKKANPPFDPTKTHQPNFFLGDTSAWWPDHGVTVWMTEDTPAGVHYKLYVKIPQASDPLTAFTAPPATTVKSMAVSDTWRLDLPDVTLSATRFWTLVGTFTVKPDGKLEFKEATQAERDAEWTKLSKGATPPPTPPPTASGTPSFPFGNPAAQPSAAAISPEEQQRRQQQRQASPSSSPTASP